MENKKKRNYENTFTKARRMTEGYLEDGVESLKKKSRSAPVKISKKSKAEDEEDDLEEEEEEEDGEGFINDEDDEDVEDEIETDVYLYFVTNFNTRLLSSRFHLGVLYSIYSICSSWYPVSGLLGFRTRCQNKDYWP